MIDYKISVLGADIASVFAQLDVAFEENFHLVGELECLKEGERQERHPGKVGTRGFLPRSHQLVHDDAAVLIRQRNSVGSVSIVSDTFLNTEIESWVAFDGDDHRQNIANLDQSVNTWSVGSFSDLDVHAGRC